jgi:glycosyltransferase involved in cell wall biosynthesis
MNQQLGCARLTKAKEISIIIITCKEQQVTVNSLSYCPVPYQLILSRKYGTGHARNYGAKQAKHDLLVFLDDDLILKPEIWDYVLTTNHGEFRMTFLSDFPCTRVMSIHKHDFWKVGGFDEKIQVTGEDREFYARAVEHGLKFTKIPINLTIHKHHTPRSKNKRTVIRGAYEDMRFVLKYGMKHPSQVFKSDFIERAKKGRFRTLMLELMFLPYCVLTQIFKGKLQEDGK